jgi:hypothetical protein
MKRLSLAIIFACCTLAVAAQEGFRVDYQGTRPSMLKYRKKSCSGVYNIAENDYLCNELSTFPR